MPRHAEGMSIEYCMALTVLFISTVEAVWERKGQNLKSSRCSPSLLMLLLLLLLLPPMLLPCPMIVIVTVIVAASVA